MGIGWSIHREGGWMGHWERVVRWRRRIDSAVNHSPEDVEDFVYAFFQNCHHLREWVQQTSSIPQRRIEDLVAQHLELKEPLLDDAPP